jgi:prevent-host-death family protein
MKTVKIAELKDRLSEHLRAVERGAVSEVIVTDRDRPIARIVPIERQRAGVVIRPSKVPFASIRRLRFKPARWAVSSLELLRQERGDR